MVVPDLNGGGAERVVLNLANSLVQNGYRVSIVTFERSGPLWSSLDSRVETHNLNTKRLFRSLYALVAAVRRIKPSIVFSTLGYVNLAVLALRSLFPRETRVWIREANLPPASLLNGWTDWLTREGCQLLYKYSDLVIASSELMRNRLINDYSVRPRRIRILPSPVDVGSVRESAGKRQGLSENEHSFICVGRLTGQKGFDRLLQLWANTNLPSSRLLILGEGPQREEFVALSHKLGIQDRVTFLGFVDNPWPYVAASDALLLPSRWEGMPNVALEALACGTSVIATPECGAIGELATQAPVGAVTVAEFGPAFAGAMQMAARKIGGYLRPSLLPPQYQLDTLITTVTPWIHDRE